MNISPEEIKKARLADLYSFLLTNHANQVKKAGKSLRLHANHSISIKQGYSGYYDFSNSDHGNSIDFLVRYLGYSFLDAVLALNNQAPPIEREFKHPTKEGFPTIGDGHDRIIKYLKSRGIDEHLVKILINAKLIYQDDHNNVVFISRGEDFCEIRGTSKVPFKSIRKPYASDTAWYFNDPYSSSEKPQKCYICESAIDAISLYLLLRENAFYASIGGVGNQPTIDRIKKLPLDIILAVDNDIAGEQCRQRNPDLAYIIPTSKDWNDDLVQLRQNS